LGVLKRKRPEVTRRESSGNSMNFHHLRAFVFVCIPLGSPRFRTILHRILHHTPKCLNPDVLGSDYQAHNDLCASYCAHIDSCRLIHIESTHDSHDNAR